MKTEDAEPDDTQHDQPSHILKRVEELWDEHKQFFDRKTKLVHEVEVSRPWGDWGTKPIDQLKNLNIIPHFYVTSEKNYTAKVEQLEQEYVIKIINRERDKVYFAVLEVPEQIYVFPLSEARLPMASVAELEKELDDIALQQQTIQRKLAKYALQRERLAVFRNELMEKLELYLAGQSVQSEVADSVSVLTAFVPEPQNAQVEEFLEQEQVLCLKTAATIEDNPPVKLKNNKFSRLFEPIGEMYMPPRYDELDVTAYFSPFYMLFFGFCLGDLGYGVTLVLLAAILKRKMPKMRPILNLVQFLGIGSIIMPLFSGAFFGMNLGELLDIKGVFLNDIQMFWLAIAFGGVQIIFAKIVHAVDSMLRRGWQHGLSHLGWALLLIGCALLVGLKELEMPIPEWVIYAVLYLGLALILFFTNLSKNVFVRVGKGIASLYDVTGLFGDLLSYIRLFGLSAAGGILGFVVNTVGMMMWNVSYIGWLIGGLVFVLGHIAVLALGSLGAFVHPMRLTFVEFYKNVGFSGGGKPYKPLKKLSKS